MNKTLRYLLGQFRLPRKVDLTLLFYCLALSLIGVVFIGSAKITSEETVFRDVLLSVIKQGIMLVAAIVVMMYVAHNFSDKKMLKRLPFYTAVVTGLLLLCLFMPMQGVNARGWIMIPIPFIGFSIQPSEFSKIIMILLVAYTMCNRPSRASFWDLIQIPFLIGLFYVLLIWRLQNDFGSASVVLAVTFLCMMIPSHPKLTKGHKYIFFIVLVLVLLLLYMTSPAGASLLDRLPLEEYQKARFRNVTNPFGDFYGTGYQVGNSLIAFARGGWRGVGLGKSVQKFGYLPKAHNDFIIAVIAEEGGALWLFIVFFLFIATMKRLIQYALKARCEEHKVILFGTCSYLFVHMLLNIGGATAFIPLTGVPLLMLSSGGTSLLTWYILLGISESIIASIRRGEETGVVS